MATEEKSKWLTIAAVVSKFGIPFLLVVEGQDAMYLPHFDAIYGTEAANQGEN